MGSKEDANTSKGYGFIEFGFFTASSTSTGIHFKQPPTLAALRDAFVHESIRFAYASLSGVLIFFVAHRGGVLFYSHLLGGNGS